MARTVDEILRGLRGLIAEDESIHSGDQIDADAVHHAIQKFADELEAAWKLEKSQSWHHREMEELILRHEKEVAELKKQIGNAAALREALGLAIDMPNWCCAQTDDPLECNDYRCVYQEEDGKAGADCPWKKIRASMNAPARNCDVGTAKEQTERMLNEYCLKHDCLVFSHGGEELRCPLYQDGDDCRLKWAQMPYAEKGAGNEGNSTN